MKSWSRATTAEYRGLELRAHRLLADVPLHDVWRVFLPGEDRPCSMEDVRAVFRGGIPSRHLSLPVRGLFALRRGLGRLAGWDRVPPARETWSFETRLTDDDRRRSLVTPGTRDGPFTVLYVHPAEAVSEIRNATVHAFLVWAVQPAAGGHQLFWAVHVLPVGAWTAAYLAVIDPFRRRLIYPSLLRMAHETWVRAGPTTGPGA